MPITFRTGIEEQPYHIVATAPPVNERHGVNHEGVECITVKAFETGILPDLRIEYLSNNKWHLEPISDQARVWFTSIGLSPQQKGQSSVETDLFQINQLTAAARKHGFRLEYVGPLAVVRL